MIVVPVVVVILAQFCRPKMFVLSVLSVVVPLSKLQYKNQVCFMLLTWFATVHAMQTVAIASWFGVFY